MKMLMTYITSNLRDKMYFLRNSLLSREGGPIYG